MVIEKATANSDLHTLVQVAVTAVGLTFVGMEFLGGGRSRIFRVYVESSIGMLHADLLAKVSRQISAALEVEALISGPYTLEVSSPGLDRPLFYLSDYERFLGQRVRVQLKNMQEGMRHYTVILRHVEGKDIVGILDSDLEITFHFDNIARANLVPSW